MTEILFIVIFFLVIIQRISEIFLSKKNSKIAIAKGAVEFGKSHYFLFFPLHIGWLLSWLFEFIVSPSLSPFWILFTIIFILAEILRYWAIYSLGENWNTRIFVIDGNEKISSGPYKFLNHPNYLAVALELFFLPMIFNAFFTAVIFSILNAIVLIFIRIPKENEAWKNQI